MSTTKHFWLAVILASVAVCSAQNARPIATIADSTGTAAPAHTFDSLTLLGSDIPMPAFHETIMGDHTAMRRAMLRHGLAFRINSLPIFSVNMVAGPVAANQQTYVGQRPFLKWMSNPMLTWDLKALHINGAQLHMGMGLEWESWGKAGPNSVDMSTLYLFKSVDEGRFEVKSGYLANNLEFVGMQAGGSLLTGAQGVYAVLPYEAGLSFFPEVSPGLNLKWNAPAHMYVKGGLQRSPDPAGAQTTIDRNRFGLRFMPKGEKLVTIAETGYRRNATSTARWTWLRGGYVHNSTPYSNYLTGTKTSGNYCGYLLGDLQFTHGSGPASNGFYAGASAMITPASMNTYTQYYEVRAYDEGLFRSRPADTISLIGTHSVYSRDLVRNLAAQGKSFWRNTSSITGSYTVRASRGVYFSMGVGYIAGPAVTPHGKNALVATVAPAIFF
jgi:porin